MKIFIQAAASTTSSLSFEIVFLQFTRENSEPLSDPDAYGKIKDTMGTLFKSARKKYCDQVWGMCIQNSWPEFRHVFPDHAESVDAIFEEHVEIAGGTRTTSCM